MERAERPTWGRYALAGFVALVVATNIAGVFWARLIESSPTALIALSSRNRYLALALGADLPLISYWIIGPARIIVAFLICHMIGRAYRTTALDWFTRYLGVDPSSLDAFQRGFDRASIIVVPFFVGSNLVAALSGVRLMSMVRLLPLLAVGISARLALIQWLASVFDSQLTAFLEWLQRYSWWAVGASVVLVLAINWRNVRSGPARCPTQGTSQQRVEPNGESRRRGDPPTGEHDAGHEALPVVGVLPDRQGLPRRAEHDLLMGDHPPHPHRVDPNPVGAETTARVLERVEPGRVLGPSTLGRLHRLRGGDRGSRWCVDLGVVVELDDLRGVEIGRGHRREPGHERGRDGEVSCQHTVHPAGVEGVGERGDIIR